MVKFAFEIAKDIVNGLPAKMESYQKSLQEKKMNEKLIEISDVEPINKGALLATCSVRIVPWKLTFHDVKIFSKGQNRWLTLPSKEFTNQTGEKKYIPQITFDSDSVATRFRNQVMAEFDFYLEGNPDMTPEPLIRNEDVPF